jgi:DNA end-binding protein Ku
MARVVWKGAIVFGLVNIPVDLYPGEKQNELDFDWIDKRDMAPVGYQRINKSTGRPVKMDDIVKGYEFEKGRYVVLSDDDFKAANPKATQSVEILAFVDAASVPPQFFERPYRLAAGKRGEKGYALLRETLKRTKKAGLAQVVVRTKQHLALLLPAGPMLSLITLRWADEVLGTGDLDLPGDSLRGAGVSDKELALAERLVEDMSEPFKPQQYRDTYRDDLMARIEELATEGRAKSLKDAQKEAGGEGAQVIDLMAALRKSLEGKGARAPARAAEKEPGTPARKRTAVTKPRSAKTATRKRA